MQNWGGYQRKGSKNKIQFLIYIIKSFPCSRNKGFKTNEAIQTIQGDFLV